MLDTAAYQQGLTDEGALHLLWAMPGCGQPSSNEGGGHSMGRL